MAEEGEAASGSMEKAEPTEDALDAMGRKIWDKDFYSEKAKQNIIFGPERIGKRKDPVIPLPSSQRSYLKQRSVELELERNLGKSSVVTPHTIKPLQGGYWCSVCECLLKDSATYLDHVNGRRHNRNLGMNMKVEKIGADRIREKLKSMRTEPEAAEPEDIVARIQALEAEQEEKKRRRKEKRKRKKGGAGEKRSEGEDSDADHAAVKRGSGGVEEGEVESEDEETKMLKQLGLPVGFG